MADDARVTELKAEIERNRGLLDALKFGSLHVGDGPLLRGNGDRTEAMIISLERQIAENETLLKSYHV